MASAMQVSVNLRDTDVFNEILHIIKGITEDTRVPEEVKIEVKEKLNKIISGKENVCKDGICQINKED